MFTSLGNEFSVIYHLCTYLVIWLVRNALIFGKQLWSCQFYSLKFD